MGQKDARFVEAVGDLAGHRVTDERRVKDLSQNQPEKGIEGRDCIKGPFAEYASDIQELDDFSTFVMTIYDMMYDSRLDETTFTIFVHISYVCNECILYQNFTDDKMGGVFQHVAPGSLSLSVFECLILEHICATLPTP
jgi:hypothetical protein